jgi:hypothetical protein
MAVDELGMADARRRQHRARHIDRVAVVLPRHPQVWSARGSSTDQSHDRNSKPSDIPTARATATVVNGLRSMPPWTTPVAVQTRFCAATAGPASRCPVGFEDAAARSLCLMLHEAAYRFGEARHVTSCRRAVKSAATSPAAPSAFLVMGASDLRDCGKAAPRTALTRFRAGTRRWRRDRVNPPGLRLRY